MMIFMAKQDLLLLSLLIRNPKLLINKLIVYNQESIKYKHKNY